MKKNFDFNVPVILLNKKLFYHFLSFINQDICAEDQKLSNHKHIKYGYSLMIIDFN